MSIPEGVLYSDGILEVGRQQETHPHDSIRTFKAEEDIEFGRALVEGTDVLKDVILADDPAGVFRGVSCWSVDASEIENDKYLENDVVAVIDEGIINVYTEEAISLGDEVRIRHTVDTGKFKGDFATTADAGKTALLSNAEFLSETSGAGVVVVRLGKGSFALTADV